MMMVLLGAVSGGDNAADADADDDADADAGAGADAHADAHNAHTKCAHNIRQNEHHTKTTQPPT